MNRRSGFTLVEMLVVMAIIAILAAILFPALTAMRNKSMGEKSKADLRKIDAAVRQYQGDYHDYIYCVGDVAWTGDSGDTWNPANFAMRSSHMLYKGLRYEYLKMDVGNTHEQRYVDAWCTKKRSDSSGAFIYLWRTWEWKAAKDLYDQNHANPDPSDSGVYDTAGTEYNKHGRPDKSADPEDGFEGEFELWSAGVDQQFTNLRGGTGDKDNQTVTLYRAP